MGRGCRRCFLCLWRLHCVEFRKSYSCVGGVSNLVDERPKSQALVELSLNVVDTWCTSGGQILTRSMN